MEISKPYVKKYDATGKVSNPITQKNPYLHPLTATTRERRRGHEKYTLGIKDTIVVCRKTTNGHFINPAGKRVPDSKLW